MVFMTLSGHAARGGFFVEKFGSAQIAGGRYYEHPPTHQKFYADFPVIRPLTFPLRSLWTPPSFLRPPPVQANFRERSHLT
jgi:hypothetical protein